MFRLPNTTTNEEDINPVVSWPNTPTTARNSFLNRSAERPGLGGFLAWLVPGLGHWYQGRRTKAVLFFVCIMGDFQLRPLSSGAIRKEIIRGTKLKIGYGRAVYFAWNDEEWRMQFFCQIGVGLPTLPAMIQALRVNGGKAPMRQFHGPAAHGKSARPLRETSETQQPTLIQLHFYLDRYMELATTYTMIGGLLNVLAIYDAFAGPVFLSARRKKRKKRTTKRRRKRKRKNELSHGSSLLIRREFLPSPVAGQSLVRPAVDHRGEPGLCRHAP